jgi:hypothetical protein
MLGDAWVDRSLANANTSNGEFQNLITRLAWHESWSRPGLDAKTRRIIVLSALGGRRVLRVAEVVASADGSGWVLAVVLQFQLSILTSSGLGAPFQVSSSDFKLIRKIAHLVLQWCMNSTGSFQPWCLNRTMT